MLKNLPKWYNLATITPLESKQFESRSKVVLAIVANQSDTFFFDCIRLYLGKPTTLSGFLSEFGQYFSEDDPMFINNGENIIECRVLAGTVISEVIQQGGDLGILVATTLQSALFGIDSHLMINYEIIEEAKAFLIQESIAQRERRSFTFNNKLPLIKEGGETAENLVGHMKTVNKFVKEFFQYVDDQNAEFQKRFELLEEESNIHWWLFRGFSEVKNAPIKDLDSFESPLILSFELEKLIKFHPTPISITQLLSKSLSLVNELPKEVCLKDVVNLLNTSLKSVSSSSVFSRFGNLAPIHYALSKASELDFAENWVSSLKNSSGIDCEMNIPPLDLSVQFLTELTLTKL